MPVTLRSRGERGGSVGGAAATIRDPECYATTLRKASRRLTALYDEAVAPSGLRSTQYAILCELTVGEPLTVNELARVLVLDRSGLGHSPRPPRRDGLIDLGRSATDRRSVQVTLTDQGRRRFQEAGELWRSAQAKVVDVLGASMAQELREQLNGIAEDERLT